MRLAARAAAVVAVDFSLVSLEVLQGKLAEGSQVALVQADVTQPHLAPRSLDRVLSTLHSNLPSREHRIAALRQTAQALRPHGRAVISMHHYGVRELLRMQPAAGRYTGSGIYRYFMRAREAMEETSRAFGSVRLTYVRASVPGVPSTVVASAAAAVPILRSALGQIFLASCERPL
jgi:SAM-dependent methyltransferase